MYTVTFLNPNDEDLVQEVLTYVEHNADAGIRPRPDWVMKQAIDTGEVLLLERDDKLAGVSFIYEFHEKPGTGHSYLELGTMMIPDEADNGFRGQQMFSAIHIYNLCWANDNALPHVFAVVEDNTASHHIMTKHAGMIERSVIPDDLKAWRAAAGTPFNPNKMAVWADEDVVLKNLKTLKEMIRDENLIVSPKNGTEITVNVHPLNHEYIDLLIEKRT